ncbi:hypothetical protein D9619_011360 [Psilocybe cf. subviscida]|uniref:Uncharacterized protein n=1 Tax=Psilocybe cf. subviscida TaxID=2480587 RepID=A0A8H5F598_9AGAR|nr:hypothetical protein D9619_011360 [Psilocybe cf. subviscida]
MLQSTAPAHSSPSQRRTKSDPPSVPTIRPFGSPQPLDPPRFSQLLTPSASSPPFVDMQQHGDGLYTANRRSDTATVSGISAGGSLRRATIRCLIMGCWKDVLEVELRVKPVIAGVRR